MTKIKFIPPIEVWRRYARANVIVKISINGRYKRRYNLSHVYQKFNDRVVWQDIALQVESVLNRYFGNLTCHEIKDFTSNLITLKCTNCRTKDKKNSCDAHVGIVKGLMEALWGTEYRHSVTKGKEKCFITLYSEENER